jgi:hypothetical protein
MTHPNDRLEYQFGILAQEWSKIVGRSAQWDAEATEAGFRVLLAEQGVIQAKGDWMSGPSDLLSILRMATLLSE